MSILAQETADDLEVLANFMVKGEMTSVIDRRFELAAVADAIGYSETGRARGKIIVNVR